MKSPIKTSLPCKKKKELVRVCDVFFLLSKIQPLKSFHVISIATRTLSIGPNYVTQRTSEK